MDYTLKRLINFPCNARNIKPCHPLNIRHNGQLDTVLPTQTFENDLIVLLTEQL
jgi:hypothetical protein